jgi:hypothetical protein
MLKKKTLSEYERAARKQLAEKNALLNEPQIAALKEIRNYIVDNTDTTSSVSPTGRCCTDGSGSVSIVADTVNRHD